MARRRTVRRGSVGYRPASDWLAGANGGTLDPLGECDIFPLYDSQDTAATARTDPMTWLRCRGLIVTNGANAETTPVGVSAFAWGIGLATAQSLAVADAAGVPCPWSDAHWDGWLAHGFSFMLPTNVGPGPVTLNTVQTIDSRAMRRIEDNVVYLAVELGPGEGRTINYNWALRFLLQPSSKRS